MYSVKYSGLFNINDMPQDYESEENYQIKNEKLESNLNTYKWYGLVYTLASGDITKNEQVFKLNYIAALNHLSYKKILTDIENDNNKRQINR